MLAYGRGWWAVSQKLKLIHDFYCNNSACDFYFMYTHPTNQLQKLWTSITRISITQISLSPRVFSGPYWEYSFMTMNSLNEHYSEGLKTEFVMLWTVKMTPKLTMHTPCMYQKWGGRIQEFWLIGYKLFHSLQSICCFLKVLAFTFVSWVYVIIIFFNFLEHFDLFATDKSSLFRAPR